MNDQDDPPREPNASRRHEAPRRGLRLVRSMRRWFPVLFVAGACLATPMVAQAAPSGGTPSTGVEYDGIMVARSTLGDVDTDAVAVHIHPGNIHPGNIHPGNIHPGNIHPGNIHPGHIHPGNIQSDLAATEAVDEQASATDGSGGVPKWLPWALLGGVVVVLIAFGSRTIGVIDRRTVPWFDATLKATAVVIGMILLTTIIPAKVIESDAVRDLSRNAQDLITMGFWAVGLFGGLWALWWAHRENRI